MIISVLCWQETMIAFIVLFRLIPHGWLLPTVDSINLDPWFLFIIRKNKHARKNSWKKIVYSSPYLTRIYCTSWNLVFIYTQFYTILMIFFRQLNDNWNQGMNTNFWGDKYSIYMPGRITTESNWFVIDWFMTLCVASGKLKIFSPSLVAYVANV